MCTAMKEGFLFKNRSAPLNAEYAFRIDYFLKMPPKGNCYLNNYLSVDLFALIY